MNVQITDLAPAAPGTRPAGPTASDEGGHSFGDLLDSLLSGQGDQAGSGTAGPDVVLEAGLIGLGGFIAAAPAARPGLGTAPGTSAGAGPAVEVGAARLTPASLAALPGSPLPGSPLPGSPLPGSLPVGSTLAGPTPAGATLPGPILPGSALPGAPLPGTGPVPAQVSEVMLGVAAPGVAAQNLASTPIGGLPIAVAPDAVQPATGPTGAAPVPGADQTVAPVEATVGGGAASGADLGDQSTAPRSGENLAARPAELAAPTTQAAFIAVHGAGTTAASGAPAGTAGGTAVPAPVSSQLFDAVSQAAQGGVGSHRMTVRLDPGTLGEVRVHLIARDGALQVHLTAGHEALAALGDGSGELQRLLQSTGAVDVKVTVRDLGADAHRPGQDGSPASADTSGTSGGSAGDRTGREQGDPMPAPDLRAWMPERTTPQRGQGQGGPNPHDPTGSTPARVDLAL